MCLYSADSYVIMKQLGSVENYLEHLQVCVSYLGTDLWIGFLNSLICEITSLCIFLCLYTFNHNFFSIFFIASTVLTAQESFPNSLGHLQKKSVSCDSRGQTTKARFLYGWGDWIGFLNTHHTFILSIHLHIYVHVIVVTVLSS